MKKSGLSNIFAKDSPAGKIPHRSIITLSSKLSNKQKNHAKVFEETERET